MINPRTIAAVLVASGLAFAPAGFSQEVKKPNLRQEIVRLKYVKNNQVLSILYTFLGPQGRINPNPDSGMLTISDYPENVDKILAVLREVDVKPADIQFTIQLVLGSAMPDQKSDDAIKDDPVIRELKQMLRFKSFSLLDTSYVRALDRQLSQVTMGRAAELRLDLIPRYVRDGNADIIQVEATLYKVGPVSLIQMPQGPQNVAPPMKTLVNSNFTLKSGEKTVVGVSRMDGGETGLILIITGKMLK
jgi:hypothetical protein